MEYIIGFLLGSIFMFLVFIIPNTARGVLRIDHSNPEKDIYRFEVGDFDKLNKKRKIVLKVDNNAKLSHKKQWLLWEYVLFIFLERS